MVFLLLAVGLSGCVGEGIVVGTSKIQYSDFEGGFYGIVSDDGELYGHLNDFHSK